MKNPSSEELSRGGSMLVVALCGAPGSGKSTLARALAGRWNAPVLDKDVERVRLFGAAGVAYTREQDDACWRTIEARLGAWAGSRQVARALVDGRTFGRKSQVGSFLLAARDHGFEVRFVQCVAPADVLRARIEADVAAGRHPARNRDVALLERWLAEREPLAVPHLTIDTHALSLADQVARVERDISARRGT